MFVKLFLLFVTLPLVELALLLVLSQYLLGWGATLLLVIATGVGGAWLAQRQGTQALRRMREDLAAGRMPTDSATDAVLIFAAGLLLMTPGVISDATGIFLLVPMSRALAKRWLFRWFQSHFQIPSFRPPPGGEVIDSYTVSSKTREDVA